MSWLGDKWEKVTSTVSNTWKEKIQPQLEKGLDWVEKKYDEAIDYLGEKLDDVIEFFASEPIDFDPVEFEQGKALSKEEIEKRANQVVEYKENVQIWSENQGKNIAKGLFKIYEEPLSDLEELGIDITEIKDTITENSENLKTIIRDYVNEKIGSGNSEFKNICDNEVCDYNTYVNSIKKYTKRVQKDAKKELLQQFKELSKSTKELVENCITAQHNRVTAYLEELKQKLVNLSGDEDAVNKELLRTGEIVAITALIESIAQEKIL